MGQLVGKHRGQAVLVSADGQDQQENEDLAVGQDKRIGRLFGAVRADDVDAPVQQTHVGGLLRVWGVVHGAGQETVHDPQNEKVIGVARRRNLVFVLRHDLRIAVIAHFPLEPVGDPE